MFRIAQLSDLHCGQQFFLPQHLERAIAEVNELAPDLVVISGDLTTNGFKDEYVLAREYLNRVDCDAMVVIPGNHDSRNVGYVHFEELFGERNSTLRVGNGDGRRGRLERARPRQRPDRPRPLPLDRGAVRGSRPTCACSSCTITCCRCRAPAASATSSTTPATRSSASSGREVDLVLAGHKHVPYAWRLENLFVVNAGTVSSSRLRGNGRPCYNVVEVEGTHVDVWRRYPFHGQERIIQFSTDTKTYEKYTARIEDEVRSS